MAESTPASNGKMSSRMLKELKALTPWHWDTRGAPAGAKFASAEMEKIDATCSNPSGGKTRRDLAARDPSQTPATASKNSSEGVDGQTPATPGVTGQATGGRRSGHLHTGVRGSKRSHDHTSEPATDPANLLSPSVPSAEARTQPRAKQSRLQATPLSGHSSGGQWGGPPSTHLFASPAPRPAATPVHATPANAPPPITLADVMPKCTEPLRSVAAASSDMQPPSRIQPPLQTQGSSEAGTAAPAPAIPPDPTVPDADETVRCTSALPAAPTSDEDKPRAQTEIAQDRDTAKPDNRQEHCAAEKESRVLQPMQPTAGSPAAAADKAKQQVQPTAVLADLHDTENRPPPHTTPAVATAPQQNPLQSRAPAKCGRNLTAPSTMATAHPRTTETRVQPSMTGSSGQSAPVLLVFGPQQQHTALRPAHPHRAPPNNGQPTASVPPTAPYTDWAYDRPQALAAYGTSGQAVAQGLLQQQQQPNHQPPHYQQQQYHYQYQCQPHQYQQQDKRVITKTVHRNPQTDMARPAFAVQAAALAKQAAAMQAQARTVAPPSMVVTTHAQQQQLLPSYATAQPTPHPAWPLNLLQQPPPQAPPLRKASTAAAKVLPGRPVAQQPAQRRVVVTPRGGAAQTAAGPSPNISPAVTPTLQQQQQAPALGSHTATNPMLPVWGPPECPFTQAIVARCQAIGMQPTLPNILQVQGVVGLLKGLNPTDAQQVLGQLLASLQGFCDKQQDKPAPAPPAPPAPLVISPLTVLDKPPIDADWCARLDPAITALYSVLLDGHRALQDATASTGHHAALQSALVCLESL